MHFGFADAGVAEEQAAAAVPVRPAAAVLPLLERVALPLRTVIPARGQQSEQVHVIASSMISVIAIQEDGEQIEVGVVGSEGMTGTAVLLGASPTAGVVTVLNRAGLESVACGCYGAVRRRFAQLAQADP